MSIKSYEQATYKKSSSFGSFTETRSMRQTKIQSCGGPLSHLARKTSPSSACWYCRPTVVCPNVSTLTYSLPYWNIRQLSIESSTRSIFFCERPTMSLKSISLNPKIPPWRIYEAATGVELRCRRRAIIKSKKEQEKPLDETFWLRQISSP